MMRIIKFWSRLNNLISPTRIFSRYKMPVGSSRASFHHRTWGTPFRFKMPCIKTFTGLLIILSAFMALLHQNRHVQGTFGATVALEASHRPRRPAARVASRIPIHYSKIRSESLSDLLDDDDLFDLSKRQVADDYGHLRFGKRGEDFDDYGHLRFGRSGGERK